jgi:hypothetical protein
MMDITDKDIKAITAFDTTELTVMQDIMDS